MTNEADRAPAITQAMVKAYDDYTHVTLDRRGFMTRLTELAGSAAAAAAIVPMLAASKARAAIVAADDAALTTSHETYSAASVEMRGYLAKPSEGEGPWPAVIVIHENRGLNPHTEDVARRFAKEGFVAFAPDFLSPVGGTPENEDEARGMIGSLVPEETTDRAVATVGWIAAQPGSNGNVGAVGFCWGGGLVNDLAVATPSLLAGIAYYGRQPDAASVEAIEAAMMLHYAGLDERINEGIEGYRTALEEAGVEHEIFVYDGVNHAFNNDTSAARYDKAASDLAFERSVTFLKEKLA